MKINLTTKLVAAFLGCGLLPLVALAVVTYTATNRMADGTGKRFENISIAITDKIDRTLFERNGDVQAFALNQVVLEYDDWYQKGEESRIVKAMNGLVAAYGVYYLTILVDTDGKVVAVNSKDSDGKPVDTSTLYAKNFSNTAWFRAVSSGGSKTFIEDVHVDDDVKSAFPGDDGLTLGFSAPVRDTAGKIIGYWSNRARFSLVEDVFVREYSVLKTDGLQDIELTLLDSEGKVIIDYDPAATGTESVEHNFDVLMKLNLAQKGVEAAEKAIRGESGSGVAYHARKKIDQYAGYAHLETALGYPGTNWSVLVRVDERTVLAGLTSMRNQVVWAALGCAALIMALGLWMSRKFTKPILAMRDVATRLAEGDIEQDIDHHASDEIGQLADSLRQLVGYIKGTADAADRLARGDLSRDVTPRSEVDALGNSFVQMAESQRKLTERVSSLVENARAGQLDARADLSELEGAYRDLLEKLDAMMVAVSAPISEAQAVLGRVAERDLTARMSGQYAGAYAGIAESLNLAVENLEGALDRVGTASNNVATASGEITNGCQQEARAASNQAASIEQVTASLTEITRRIRSNASDAADARAAIDRAGTAADGGRERIRDMSGAIGRIKASADETAKIVKTIDEIAFQTNLLALNAAVEAARAGDAGKGFAVVADEVRGLAMRSAEAAKSTARMIEDSVKNADEGVELNNVVLASFDEIVEHVQGGVVVMQGIAEASQEQSAAVAQINDAMGEMAKSTQQSAATTEESASAAKQLSSQAKSLLSMVSEFDIVGSVARPVPPHPPLPEPVEHADSGTFPSAPPAGADDFVRLDGEDLAALQSF